MQKQKLVSRWRPVLAAMNALIVFALAGTTANADEYLLVGLDTPGGGILRFNATTGPYRL